MARSPYEKPELYELAFAWRDYKQSVDFLIDASREAGLADIKAMVELGCGPAQYAREFARRGIPGYGVDISPEMALYAQSIYDRDNLPGGIIESDFRDFSLEKPAELAICMMATFGYLLTNDDIVRHFRSVARNLVSNGLYILELPHPRDIYDVEKSTKDVWEMENEQVKLTIDWASDSTFDPITEIDAGTVRMKLEDNGDVTELTSPDQTRRLGLGHLRALLQLAGCFEIVAMYGDLRVEQQFDSTKKSWRMIPVLKKID